jgi:hypothetical protein
MTNTARIHLHPINRGFGDGPNPATDVQTAWDVSPVHVADLLRGEYKFLRREGTSRRAARWHVWRMLSMIHDPFGWSAEIVGDPDDVDDDFDHTFAEASDDLDVFQVGHRTLVPRTGVRVAGRHGPSRLVIEQAFGSATMTLPCVVKRTAVRSSQDGTGGRAVRPMDGRCDTRG